MVFHERADQIGAHFMQHTTASCLCGDVTLTANGHPLRVGICHCKDCQKHHGAAFYAAAIFDQKNVKIVGAVHSYKGRHFCPRCGSSVFAQSDDEIEIHLGAIDSPSDNIPTYEGWTLRRAEWLTAFEGMTQHKYGRDEDDRSD